jgi:hypothetical protein
MFKDYIYAAWLKYRGHFLSHIPLITDLDPYRARRLYVKYADALLQRIPGGHQARMHEWRKWEKHDSRPLRGYPNRAWQKAHPDEAIPIEGPVVDGRLPAEAGDEIVQPGVHGLLGGAESAAISNPRNVAQGNNALTETSSLSSLGVAPVTESHVNPLKHLAVMGGEFLCD